LGGNLWRRPEIPASGDDWVSEERRHKSEANDPSTDHVILGQNEAAEIVRVRAVHAQQPTTKFYALRSLAKSKGRELAAEILVKQFAD